MQHLAEGIGPAIAVLLAIAFHVAIRRTARRELARAEASLTQARQASLQWQWATWWARNAAEYSVGDPSRAPMQRIAVAALVAENLEALRTQLAALAASEAAPETEAAHLRFAAKTCLEELEAPELPWERWRRQTGQPLWKSAPLQAELATLLRAPGGP